MADKERDMSNELEREDWVFSLSQFWTVVLSRMTFFRELDEVYKTSESWKYEHTGMEKIRGSKRVFQKFDQHYFEVSGSCLLLIFSIFCPHVQNRTLG